MKLRAISGHRDTIRPSCPGTNLYAQLPAIRAAVAADGLPKLYAPAVTGHARRAGPVHGAALERGCLDGDHQRPERRRGRGRERHGRGGRLDVERNVGLAPVTATRGRSPLPTCAARQGRSACRSLRPGARSDPARGSARTATSDDRAALVTCTASSRDARAARAARPARSARCDLAARVSSGREVAGTYRPRAAAASSGS